MNHSLGFYGQHHRNEAIKSGATQVYGMDMEPSGCQDMFQNKVKSELSSKMLLWSEYEELNKTRYFGLCLYDEVSLETPDGNLRTT